MPVCSIDPLYPHWFRCDLCGKDVAEVLPAEALDLESRTARQVTEQCPDYFRQTAFSSILFPRHDLFSRMFSPD
jgi:hypothetical protein